MRLDDGMIDICLLKPVGLGDFVRTLPKARTGKHVGHPQVEIIRGREVTLNAPGVVAYADGERFGELPMTCTCVHGALRLLSP